MGQFVLSLAKDLDNIEDPAVKNYVRRESNLN